MKNSINNYIKFTGLLLVVTGLSYLAFDKLVPVGRTKSEKKVINDELGEPTKALRPGVIVFSGPKDKICPMNGELYTKEEEGIWQKKRPLLVMIENHADARPQSGLTNADIVYEAVAEGGITRFMGVFYCGAVKGAENKYDVGPVRSARTYFLDLASEYSDYPLYVHVGGANCSAPKDPVTGRQAGPCTTDRRALAIEQISDYGWNNKGTWGDLSQFSLPYKVCRREQERTGEVRDTEHTMYCSTKELWNVAEARGLTNITEIKKSAWDKGFKPWSFKQSDKESENAEVKYIGLNFWEGYKDYAVSWHYDGAKNGYLRKNGGEIHTDFNNDEQLFAKNVVVQFVKESRSVDSHGHNLYAVIGSGKGILFQNGSKTEITWTKAARSARTVFKTEAGKEVDFVPGMIWVEVVPVGNKITYEDNSST